MGAHIITLIGIFCSIINCISSSIVGLHLSVLSTNQNCKIFGSISLGSWSLSKSTVYFIGNHCIQNNTNVQKYNTYVFLNLFFFSEK